MIRNPLASSASNQAFWKSGGGLDRNRSQIDVMRFQQTISVLANCLFSFHLSNSRRNLLRGVSLFACPCLARTILASVEVFSDNTTDIFSDGRTVSCLKLHAS